MKAVQWLFCAVWIGVPIGAQAQDEPKADAKAAGEQAMPATDVEPQPTDEAAAASFEILNAKLCSGVQDKEPIDEKREFAAGEKAWLWLKLKPEGETALRLRWSIDDKPVFTMDPVPVRLGRTWYYKTLSRAGNWKVEILDPNDQVLHSETLTAIDSGEAPRAARAPEEPAAPAPQAPAGAADDATAAATAQSTHLEVVDIKTAEAIENRKPIGEGTSFSKDSKVYTWVQLKVNDEQTVIRMRWSRDGQPVYTSDPVTVRQSSAWRTWLYKTVSQRGNWRVEILDADDNPIRSASFIVQ